MRFSENVSAYFIPNFCESRFDKRCSTKKIAKELHRPARRNFLRRAVKVKGLHNMYQADLVEMMPRAKQNKEYKYMMTVINVFSNHACAIPLKTKTDV